MIKSPKFLLLAMAALLSSMLCVSSFNPMDVDNSTKTTWCENQVGFCTNVCQELTNQLTAQQNECDIVTLGYSCICQGNITPNISEYTYTIPYFQCTYDVEACTHKCAQGDNPCYEGCKKRNCAAQFPKKYNQTIPTATPQSSTPTTSFGPNNLPTGLPPGIFGNNAISTHQRHLQSWASLGSSSVLGLLVMLAAGVVL
ncbi:hypothetical protein BGW42_003739 [Actinomortierella wolfii]|nr:hypothetical protein BGW42_003739 [Actinomortierella wolfii]